MAARGRQQLYVVAGTSRQWQRNGDKLLQPVADGDGDEKMLDRDGRGTSSRSSPGRTGRRRRWTVDPGGQQDVRRVTVVSGWSRAGQWRHHRAEHVYNINDIHISHSDVKLLWDKHQLECWQLTSRVIPNLTLARRLALLTVVKLLTSPPPQEKNTKRAVIGGHGWLMVNGIVTIR